MTPHTGKPAIDLARSHIPQDLRAEAYWWVRADGYRGSQVFYDGERDGIHWWHFGNGDRVYIKSKPRAMSNEEVERMDIAMRRYYATERERMLKVGELR